MKLSKSTLGDISKDGRGYYGIAASAVPFSSCLYTYLRITDINDDGTLNATDLKSVADDDAMHYLLKPNDIVFARTGASTGRNYFYDGTDGELVYAGFLIKFSIDPQKVNPRFVKYYCQSKTYYNWIESFNTGSTRGNINAQTLASMPIYLPEREYQDRVVSILDSIERKKRENSLINDNLEQQAQAMVSEYAERTLYSSVFSDIMNFDNGFAFQSSTYLPSGKYKIITIKNVQDGYIDSTGSAFIDSLPQRMKDNCILNIGDVLLSLTGNVGRVGIVCEENLLLNQRVAKIVPIDNKLLPFLYFVFRQSGIKTKLETIAKGTAQLNLSPIETLKLTIPYEERSAVQLSQQLEPLYRKIINNNQESYSFALLRDTLLPKLMSGEIDVSAVQL